jgi:hypothetical protein
MGGIGSSRWLDHQKARVVEDAHQLNVATFEPALKHDAITGTLRWTNPGAVEVTTEFVFSLEPASQDGSRRLVIDSDGDWRKQSVRLERAQRGWYEGWLFRCPTDCGRRVRRLYALPKWMTFTCRMCGGLTYTTTQTHDARLDLASRDPLAFIQSRSGAPKTVKSRMVTFWLLMDAQDPYRPGRESGERAMASLTRMVARWRQEYIDRWGFPPEDCGRVAKGG